MSAASFKRGARYYCPRRLQAKLQAWNRASPSEPSWYPHGALVDEKLQPKESYRRLAELIEGWWNRA